MVHVAKNPLGPYTKISGDLACEPIQGDLKEISLSGVPTPGQGCQYHNIKHTRSEKILFLLFFSSSLFFNF